MKVLRTIAFPILLTLASLALISCGGGGGSGANPPPVVVNASPGGIWTGTTSGGQTIIGIVTESGEFHFLRDDGVQSIGTAAVSGNAATASFTGITEVGTTFTDGSTSGSGTITATIAERSTINGSSTFTTTSGTAASDTFSLTYSALYDRDSSLATIMGNFQEPNGTVVSVDGNGNIFSQDASTGCVVNGVASIIDSRYDAYHIQYTFSSCTGAEAVLNGETFTGLAALDNTVAPEQAVIGVTSVVGATKLALIEVLDRI
jgi:hypothetical protein